MSHRRYITNTDNAVHADVIALIIALDRVLQDLPPLDREELECRLERHGAARITGTSLRALAEKFDSEPVDD